MRSLPGRLCVLVGVLLVCSCGSDPALSPTDSGSSVHAVAHATAPTSVVLTLSDGGIAIEDAQVWVRPASNDPAAAWSVRGTTDDRGKCILPLYRRISGYYHIKATDAMGVEIAIGTSIPVNAGEEAHLSLDASGRLSRHVIPHPTTRRFVLPGGGELEMALIPSGTFMMGSATGELGREQDEGPRTHVTLSDPFLVSRTEVTQEQWYQVMGTKPWRSFRETAERFGLSGVTVAEDGGNYPAESVGWEGVQAFIAALNAYAGAEVYRLPTEAEWEYLTRAESEDTWSFGPSHSDLDAYAWVSSNTVARGRPFAHPVGTKLPNRWGLYDVHGNVAEWTQDWYRPYRGGRLTDPQGPLTGVHADKGYRSKKVIRGGSFVDASPRSADRDFSDTKGIASGIGFRVVRVVDRTSPRRLAHYY